MRSDIQERLSRALNEAVRAQWDVVLPDPVVETPPQPKLGDLAFTVAFDLARHARKSPRSVAETLAPALQGLDGVEKVQVAGPGYLNVFLDRSRHLQDFCESPGLQPVSNDKVIVEHTNINPNKAAHIGHLRNAALGDTFVRVLRFCGEPVEVQNYIDDTGVQVADVVVGFLDLERKSIDQVKELAGRDRFDYLCWDLYARVTEYYEADTKRLARREETLKSVEEGNTVEAHLAGEIAKRIAKYHLGTMDRIGVRYDLLPWEGDILRLHFWDRAFSLLKERKAARLAEDGKNAGCWVMDLPEEADGGASDEKVLVRSNGTVTYVGKDIAYQLWKLGELKRDFGYQLFHRYADGEVVWSTTSEPSEAGAPSFGRGARVYNVIDTRQSYLQRIVQHGVSLLAPDEAGQRSHHFAYEMVALTPATCRELGFPVSDEDSNKPYLEVSGRKGLGVKADDLLDLLEDKALSEVRQRNESSPESQQRALAMMIARAALRYFMIKFTKNKVIAFDFSEALSFEGDTGPYLQYAMVRANKIVQKMGFSTEIRDLQVPSAIAGRTGFQYLDEAESDELWGLAFRATRLEHVARQVRRTEEPALLARFAFELAQRFNALYHRYPILRESDETKQAMRLFIVQLFRQQMTRALDLMGIPVPARM